MYQTLLVLFYISNILALLIFLVAFCLTVISKATVDKRSKINIGLPFFSEIATYARYCFWTGTGFILIDWLLCSSSAIVSKGKPNEVLAEHLLHFAAIWAVMIFVNIVFEIVLKLIKKKSDYTYSVSNTIPSIIWYSILYFILSFFIG